MSSGAIQYGVPTRDLRRGTSLFTCAQKPKSESLTCKEARKPEQGQRSECKRQALSLNAFPFQGLSWVASLRTNHQPRSCPVSRVSREWEKGSFYPAYDQKLFPCKLGSSESMPTDSPPLV